MSNTLSVRLDKTLAAWIARVAKRTGVSQGQIVRDQLEKARSEDQSRRYMRLAGTVDGPRDLSTRKGFSKA